MPITWLSSHDLTRQRRRPNKSASSRIFFFILFFSVILVHQCGDRNVARDMSLKAERIDCGRKFRQTSTLSVSFRGYLWPRDFANPAFVRTIYFKLAIVAAGLSDTSTSFDEEIIVDWKEEEKRWSREWGASSSLFSKEPINHQGFYSVFRIGQLSGTYDPRVSGDDSWIGRQPRRTRGENIHPLWSKLFSLYRSALANLISPLLPKRYSLFLFHRMLLVSNSTVQCTLI